MLCRVLIYTYSRVLGNGQTLKTCFSSCFGISTSPCSWECGSCGCSRLEESCCLYLVEPIAIIEEWGEEVLASTLDGDRMRRRGPGVPGGSELCLRVWFGPDMEMFSIYASLLLHRKPELLPCHFSYPLELGHLKLHTVGDVSLSHSLGIALWVCSIGLGVRVWVWGIHEGRVALLRLRMPVVKIKDEDLKP
jgi:hypothetical protein